MNRRLRDSGIAHQGQDDGDGDADHHRQDGELQGDQRALEHVAAAPETPAANERCI